MCNQGRLEMNYSIENRAYHYQVIGTGPPVLLLHGFTGSHKTWKSLQTSLLNNFQIITIDLPGHGQTTAHVENMKQCCDDLAIILDHLQVSEVHVIGYSMGGRTALSLAMYYPELVASIILESSSPGLKQEVERDKRMVHDEQMAQYIEQHGMNSFVDFWEKIPLFESQRELPGDVQQTIRHERLRQSTAGLAQSLRSMGTGKQPSWWSKLVVLHIPVLLVAGAKDHKFVKINEQMHQELPSARIVIMKNTGHAVHVEQPEKFGKLVVSFLQNQY